MYVCIAITKSSFLSGTGQFFGAFVQLIVTGDLNVNEDAELLSEWITYIIENGRTCGSYIGYCEFPSLIA